MYLMKTTLISTNKYLLIYFSIIFLKKNSLQFRFFISFCTLGHEFVWNGLQQLILLPHSVPLWVEQAGASAEARCPSLGLPFPSDHFYPLQEAVWALRVLDVLNSHINSLGKILPLTSLQWCLQHAGWHCRPFWFCHGNTYRTFLLNSPHPPDGYCITLLVDSQVTQVQVT